MGWRGVTSLVDFPALMMMNTFQIRQQCPREKD